MKELLLGDNGFKYNYGAGYEYAHYRNSTYRKIFFSGSPLEIDYNTNLRLSKFNLFGQISRSFLDEKLRLSLGIRSDINTFSADMGNPFRQLSPRFSASYALSGKVNLNMSIGRYYQLPPYTSLGYTNGQGIYVNRQNHIKYIASDHFVAGLELIPTENIQITFEGFYKKYSDYPFSVNDSVPLSSKGADYGIFGDEELISVSDGRAYGVELLGRLKEFKGLNLVFAYTFVRSEFKDFYGKYIPTAWDNRHLFNLTATKKLKKNWDIGMKCQICRRCTLYTL